jgi:hypothetical protein
MNNETCELTFCELDQASGGGGCLPVPGGSVCKGPGGTMITAGAVTINIDTRGGIVIDVTTSPK